MKNKILSFIVYDSKLLALKSLPHPKHGKGGWFTVTGAVEDNETLKEAVTREIKEETNLTVDEIFDLNWESIYKWGKDICKERNFVSFVLSKDNIKLDMVEFVECKWVSLNEFVEMIKWDNDKSELKKVLEKALLKKNFFTIDQIDNYLGATDETI